MLKVKDLSFFYENDKEILKTINFSVTKGNNLAIIGESGCGKSTLLKLIYGLYDADYGSIHWKEGLVTGPKFNLVPGMPYMKYLAQDFDLMPYVTVAENVGKFLSNFFLEDKKARIDELLDVVEMTEFEMVKAKFLSGGQMQRVALAKVLAKEPEVLLLDEPFSHIDNFRKNSLRRKIFQYLKEKQITCVIATHDVQDVLSFSDEVLVMKNGELLETGTTQSIYQEPQSFYTASLFGEVSKIPAHYFELQPTSEEEDFVLCYPHELQLVERSALRVKVLKSYFSGSHYLVEAQHDGEKVYFNSTVEINKNEEVFLRLNR
ncbi:ABC transporter ATP-binding protein [Flavobacterium sediminis]|uniref:ABC transporter ATP-binding protein n=1 Tax=Flavobacterium sediminis TaxID=2201181 RepID=A0A2U8QS90_9FLAO|nr:ABC transporter ATP-binding protein [Flavobacterium sediminis]AWM12971.1 ABC transporter ATP-binding protein [Flavobacterium sediminis]